MFSTRRSTQREKNSERDIENEAFSLNFLVHGSSIPIHSQQPKPFIKKCKTCQTTKKLKRREFPFPVEKIIYLSERLELLDLSDKNEEPNSKSSFCVSEDDNWSDGDDSKAPMGDFSLDLGSILSVESDESSTDRKAQNEDNDSVVTECDETPKVESSVTDSVNVYIKTVNKEKELVKFFRACRTCNELSCGCPSVSNTDDDDVCSFGGKALESHREFECGSCFPVTSSCCCCSCHDFFTPLCGEECECRNASYTSTLESAARSARVLARDLEFILTAWNNDSARTRRRDF